MAKARVVGEGSADGRLPRWGATEAGLALPVEPVVEMLLLVKARGEKNGSTPGKKASAAVRLRVSRLMLFD